MVILGSSRGRGRLGGGPGDPHSLPALQSSVDRLRSRIQQHGVPASEPHGSSIFQKIFNVLSAGGHFTAGMGMESARQVQEEPAGSITGQVINALTSGPRQLLSGVQNVFAPEKSTWEDVYEEAGWTEPSTARTIAGFAGDVLLDPTTYVGGGLVRGAAQGGKVASRGARGLSASENVREIVSPIIDDLFDSQVNDLAENVIQPIVGNKPIKGLQDAIRQQHTIRAQKAKEEIIKIAERRIAAKTDVEGSIGEFVTEVQSLLGTLPIVLDDAHLRLTNFANVFEEAGGQLTLFKTPTSKAKFTKLPEISPAARQEAIEKLLKGFQRLQGEYADDFGEFIEFRFMGQPFYQGKVRAPHSRGVLTRMVPDRIMNPLEDLRDRTVGSDHWIRRAFNINHMMPGGLRIIASRTMKEYSQLAKQLFHGTRELFQPMAGTAREGLGILIDGAPTVSAVDESVADVVKNARDILETIEIDRAAMGLPGTADKMDNLKVRMPIYERVKAKGYVQGSLEAGTRSRARLKNVTDEFESFEEAVLSGRDILKDPWAAIDQYVAEFYKDAQMHTFLKGSLDQFGFLLSDSTLRKSYERITGQILEDATPYRTAYKELFDKLDMVEFSAPSRYGVSGTYYMPKEIHRALSNHLQFYGNIEEVEDFWKLSEKVMGWWRFGVTVANPGHHTRNLVGDVYLNWMDGVNNPNDYLRAAAGMFASDAAKDPHLITRLAQHFGVNKVPQKMKVGNKEYNLPELYQIFQNHVGSDLVREEYSQGIIRGSNKVSRGANAGIEFVRDFATTRENFGRFAHFLSALRSEAKRGFKFDTAVANAAERVRTFNFDYFALTPFERKLKAVIPFYTFMRKNLPRQIESLYMKPGVPNTVGNVQQLFANLLGVDEPEYQSVMDRVPDWLKESGAFVVGRGESSDSPLFLDLDLPFQEAFERWGNIFSPVSTGAGFEEGAQSAAREVFNILHPAPKFAAERATGKSIFTGGDVPPFAQHLLEQVPIGRQVNQQVGRFLTGETEGNPYALQNWLTGVQRQSADENRQSGELRRQRDILQAVLAQLEEERMKQLGFAQ